MEPRSQPDNQVHAKPIRYIDEQTAHEERIEQQNQQTHKAQAAHGATFFLAAPAR
ncbi:MAG: hypothetical protein JRJ12_01865 [Deltaproteobacteria bacterium]|nr:hypothetical protein [Deltaproteobacteria bacterium]MBW2069886.1 hypothetical protein [Deltaproteobacteria bacterium]